MSNSLITAETLATMIRRVGATLALFMSCTLCGTALAATYWVSPNGQAAWTACRSDAPLNGTAACALSTANTNAAAGDTVYLRGGTYSVSGSAYYGALMPAHSGTSASNRIIFEAYTGETPVIQQGSNAMLGLWLSGVDWIKVKGITFHNFTYYIALLNKGASYNEVAYCSFTHDSTHQTGTGFIIGGYDGTQGWSVHNWIHHNYISTKRNSNPCGEGIDLMRIGNAEGDGSAGSPYSADNNNTVEYNYMEYGGHSIIDMFSKYNMVADNIVHNEPFISGCTSYVNRPIYENSAYNGLFAHRGIQVGDIDLSHPNSDLIEGNRIGFSSPNPNNGGFTNLDISTPGNVVRYNYLYAGMSSGIYFKWANSYGPNTGGTYNRVYNNTIYHNGHGWDAGTNGTGNLAYNGQGIAQYSASGQATNNVIKNNIVYDNGHGDICYLGWSGSSCTPFSIDTVVSNWVTSSGDPLFVNPALTDTLSQNLVPSAHGYTATPIPDLRLQAGSPVIDGGTYLTTATNSGSNSTTLTVADAYYFQDGSKGSSLAMASAGLGGTRQSDWIAIGTVNNTVQVISVAYGSLANPAGTIRLATPKTWSNGAHIWLYKKSDGTVVLNGAAPDMGANEFDSAVPSQAPLAPTNLRATPIVRERPTVQ